LRGRRVKAVFIDMDGTLVHLPPDFTSAHFLQRICHKLGLEVKLERIERAFAETEDWWQRHFTHDFTRWTRENFVEHNRRLLICRGLDRKEDELNNLAERVQDYWERLPEEAGELLYPEARAALEGLAARGLILGILSHRPLHTIQSSLRKHGLTQSFDIIVNPWLADAPRGKLDPVMWEYALGKAGVMPDEAAHFGDRYDHDVLGARAAGVLPVLIDREGKYKEVDCPKAVDLLQATDFLS